MSKIQTYDDYQNYFRTLATENKTLNPDNGSSPHFYEFKGDFTGNNLKYPAMVLVPPKMPFFDQNSDNLMTVFASEFWILQSVRINDAAGLSDAINNTLELGNQIIARMIKDYKSYSLGTDRPIQQMDLRSFDRNMIGPVGFAAADNAHGWSFEFTFANPSGIAFNSNNWW